MLATIREYPDCFVGVDINGDELAAESSEFLNFFKMAAEINLHATVHAGELGSPESMKYAVDMLGASRIGHGIAAARSEEAMKSISEKKCVLEICPTSNKFLGVVNEIRDLPLRLFQERKVPFAICTDNPARCRTSMSEELFRVPKFFSYSITDVHELIKSTLAASFADEPTKKRIAALLN